jgi:hypothetical protein
VLIRITSSGETTLEEPNDFRHFSIRFDPGARDAAAAQAALERVARPDGDHAWVAGDAVCRMAPRAGEQDWQDGFVRMLAFARSRGWVDDHDGIRAHIEAAP